MKRCGIKPKLIKMASILCASSMFLSGCGLFGGEEESHSISIVKENIEEEYDLIHCEKRNVIKTGTISCTYRQLLEENLSFPVGDRTVGFVYVNEGDEVKAGELLAKLDVVSLENDNITMTEQIERNEFLIKQADEKIEYYEKQLEKPGLSLSSKENYLSKLQSVRESRRNYEDENEFNRIKISANEHQIQQGSIYAGIDGNVSYIKNNLEGSNANAGETVITILNSSVTAFQAQDEKALNYVKPGDKVVIDCSMTDVSYDATVTSIEEDTYKIVFELDEPDFSITVGTRGMITVVLGERDAVLSLPNICIYDADDFHYVYVLNSDGIREMRKITIGLVGDSFTEITGGISAEDSVILRRS